MSRSDGTTREDFTVRRFVGEFNTLTFSSKHDRVIADDVTPTNGVNADFAERTFTDLAFTSVLQRIGREFAFF
jgi:hypothetical protein